MTPGGESSLTGGPVCARFDVSNVRYKVLKSSVGTLLLESIKCSNISKLYTE